MKNLPEYRIVKEVTSIFTSYGVNRVDYGENGELIFDDAYCARGPAGESLNEMLQDLRDRLLAFGHPIMERLGEREDECGYLYKESTDSIPPDILSQIAALAEILPRLEEAGNEVQSRQM